MNINILPNRTRRQLIALAISWSTVVLLEALTYLAISYAIIHHQPPWIVLTSAIVTVVVTVCVSRSGFYVAANLSASLYQMLKRALLCNKVAWFSAENRALTVKLAGQTIPSFMSIPAHQIQLFAHSILLPLFVVTGICIIISSALAIVFGVSLFISFVLQYRAQQALAKVDRSRQTMIDQTNQSSFELIDNLALLKTACGNERGLHRIKQKWETQTQHLNQLNRASSNASFFSTLASLIPLVGSILFIQSSHIYDSGTLLAAVLLSLRAAESIEKLAVAAIGINDQKAALEDLSRVMTAPQIRDVPSAQARCPSDCILRAKRLHHWCLKRPFSFQALPGERVIITGANGTGKSTLLKLMMRLEEHETGQLTLGAAPINLIPHHQLIKHITYVPQFTSIFGGTIATNISMGNPHCDESTIMHIAKALMLQPLIDRSEKGIHQPISGNDTRLSGGERQRIAIARAVARSTPILLLDESTSALDEATEHHIANYLISLGMTLIIVTHRNPSIWQATQVIHLD